MTTDRTNTSVEPSEIDRARELIFALQAENDRLRADAESWRAYRRATHCACCGAYKPNCVCGGGMTTTSTGERKSFQCSPESHGRKGYGWDD